MENIFRIFIMLGIWTIFITPLTLIIGIINAIKKPAEKSIPYMIMAILSAYLIIMLIIGLLMRL